MTVPVDSRRVLTVVGELHVETSGEGPVMFCWPSLYGDARTLDPVVNDLARDHRVVVVDGPGHGRSGSSATPFSLDDCADAAMHILDLMGVQRVVWVGAAWGGHVGVAVARRYSHRLDGLVILNAPMRPWRGRRRVLMRFAYVLLWLFGPRSFVARMLSGKMIARNAAPDRDAMLAAVTAAVRRCDQRGLLLAARSEMFERGDLVPLLPEVRIPTLFVTGAEDELFPVREARGQAAAIPDCRLVVVERSSHHSALEAPQQTLAAIRQHIAASFQKISANDTTPVHAGE